mmetsp:Transcript_28413/g.39536  ORF Transcript_28413/g.39536 Transcript_28413/m.39536 type:complete len:132 (-) Transcript_28413:326-721(-)
MLRRSATLRGTTAVLESCTPQTLLHRHRIQTAFRSHNSHDRRFFKPHMSRVAHAVAEYLESCELDDFNTALDDTENLYNVSVDGSKDCMHNQMSMISRRVTSSSIEFRSVHKMHPYGCVRSSSKGPGSSTG